MTMLRGGRVRGGALRLGELAVPLPDAVQARVQAGQVLTLGVRPEAARVVEGDGPLPEGVHLQGVVEVVEPDFAHRTQLVYARTGTLTYAATGELDPSLNVGDPVEIVFPVDQLYFFDGESERRVG